VLIPLLGGRSPVSFDHATSNATPRTRNGARCSTGVSIRRGQETDARQLCVTALCMDAVSRRSPPVVLQTRISYCMQSLAHQRARVRFSRRPALRPGPILNQRRRHICQSAFRRSGVTGNAARGCPSAWVVVLVAILPRRSTVTLCHNTSLACMCRCHRADPGVSAGTLPDVMTNSLRSAG